jgi:2-polyprenyl-6-methoxyphenol hydroxylase-like FAD-dependent oxidoreductase
VVDSYRNGRLLLMGDAAHVHSPAGGQGMNTGLVDAVVLGRLLRNVLRNIQPEAALDTYSSLRRPAAIEVLGLAGQLTGMATTRSGPRRAIRNALLHTIDCLQPAKSRVIMNLSGLSRKQYAEVA